MDSIRFNRITDIHPGIYMAARWPNFHNDR